MKLKSVFLRFYKSFNYDYIRESSSNPIPKAWEFFDDKWYPHVRVRLDDRITTIVGENESGKSCLLEAIEYAVTGICIDQGHPIQYRDFCRHSRFSSVREGHVHYPQFGAEWGVAADEAQEVLEACQIAPPDNLSRFWLFRSEGSDSAELYLSDTQGTDPHHLSGDVLAKLTSLLPRPFRLKPHLALPETVPIGYLAGERQNTDAHIDPIARSDTAIAHLIHGQRASIDDPSTGDQTWAALKAQLPPASPARSGPGRLDPEELELAHDLVRRIARVDAGVLERLHQDLIQEDDAFCGDRVDKINDELRNALNLSRFWEQDISFQLAVEHAVHDLSFLVRDRTNRTYSFAERSDGLRYFLSYYIQYLRHQPEPEGTDEILLMDEPDRYLSRQGQQDLMKIFNEFAYPREQSRRPIQVVYVTHSPFLLDRNHAERVRVLQKGSDHDGTRVVRDVGRHHYEPLRSAFGPFVAETTFIGGCNLMVEGISDQVLLAGSARHLRAVGTPPSKTLDLNRINIVPVGSAPDMPYMTYLATGRKHVDKPLVLALLDSDPEGDLAKRTLLKGVKLGARPQTPLLKDFQILQIADVHSECRNIEDLVPKDVAVLAARKYLAEYLGWDGEKTSAIQEDSLDDSVGPVFDALQHAISSVAERPTTMHKVGFARAVVEVMDDDRNRPSEDSGPGIEGLRELEARMGCLMEKLNGKIRKSLRLRTQKKIRKDVGDLLRKFFRDHPEMARKEQALYLIEDIREVLDDSQGSFAYDFELQTLRKEYRLDDTTEHRDVQDYGEFRRRTLNVEHAAARRDRQGEGPNDPSS